MNQMMMKTFALESPLKAHSLNVRTAIKTNQGFTSPAMPSICCFVTTTYKMQLEENNMLSWIFPV